MTGTAPSMTGSSWTRAARHVASRPPATTVANEWANQIATRVADGEGGQFPRLAVVVPGHVHDGHADDPVDGDGELSAMQAGGQA